VVEQTTIPIRRFLPILYLAQHLGFAAKLYVRLSSLTEPTQTQQVWVIPVSLERLTYGLAALPNISEMRMHLAFRNDRLVAVCLKFLTPSPGTQLQ
jgi:hypothetical protein